MISATFDISEDFTSGRPDLCTGGAPNFRPGQGGHGCSRLGPAEECGGRAVTMVDLG